MAGTYGALDRNYNKRKPKFTFKELTLGTVIDTNDPQQMGRVRAHCPQLGDTAEKRSGEIPWASYITPLGGVDQLSSRGREDNVGNFSQGTVAYGMWSVPNVGSTVLIGCIDGDTKFRVWLGCLHGQYMTHTLPHGRFVGADGGPITSEETPLEPLASSHVAAFADKLDSPEYASRGRDGRVSGLDAEIINSTESNLSALADDGGYTRSRFDPDLPSQATGVNRDSQINSWTTPGFHGFSMDDNADNCRIRIRTTHGAQVLIDDTNERIYIQSSEGKTWVELDEKGNIDIFGEETVSIRSRGDINLTADKTVRIAGKTGVHIATDATFRVSSATTDIKASGEIRVESTGSTLSLKASDNIDIDSAADIVNTAGGLFSVGAATGTLLFSTSFAFSDPVASLNAGNYFGASFATGSISMDSILTHTHPYTWTDPGGASNTSPGSYSGDSLTGSSAAPSGAGTALSAYFSNRVPDHEPNARMYLSLATSDNDGTTLTYPSDGNFVSVSEYSEDSDLVGKGSVERDINFTRNGNWRR